MSSAIFSRTHMPSRFAEAFFTVCLRRHRSRGRRASAISRRMLRQKGDLKMDNEKESGQQSAPPNPSQKDPQKERDSQQQRQGGTQQDPQRRPGQSEQDQDRDKDQQKDRKSA